MKLKHFSNYNLAISAFKMWDSTSMGVRGLEAFFNLKVIKSVISNISAFNVGYYWIQYLLVWGSGTEVIF